MSAWVFGMLWIAALLFAANLLILGPWLLIDFSNQPWNNGFVYMRDFADVPRWQLGRGIRCNTAARRCITCTRRSSMFW